MYRNLALTASLTITGVLCSCGPQMRVHPGPLKSERIHIDRAKAERANLELNIGTGELNADAGGNDLISGDFEYNVPSLQPELKSSTAGSHAVVTIRQPSSSGINLGDVKNRWSLHLNRDVLWDIAVNCGAGKAQLGLGSVGLRSLEIHIGVGQVDVNLEGTPKHDYEVNISGGIGQATVHLPKNVGVRAEAHGGIGSINITGLANRGDHYENDLYDSSKVNVRVKVDGGIGEIRLVG